MEIAFWRPKVKNGGSKADERTAGAVPRAERIEMQVDKIRHHNTVTHGRQAQGD
jgi:hypothetical protein